MTYLDCWTEVASTLLGQAVAGEPELTESFPRPFASGSFACAATLEGEVAGQFSVTVDAAILELPLLGEGQDQKKAWEELLREIAEAAAGELLTRSGIKCRVTKFGSAEAASQVSRAFQLGSGERAWTILVRDEVTSEARAEKPAENAERRESAPPPDAPVPQGVSPGLQLLLDVELEATLRFGCCAMPLGEILELGPGDVVQLDRHVSDPVDLIVGDKIVARGDVVLVNGNFGLRVSEVAVPRRRLESIRCLF